MTSQGAAEASGCRSAGGICTRSTGFKVLTSYRPAQAPPGIIAPLLDGEQRILVEDILASRNDEVEAAVLQRSD